MNFSKKTNWGIMGAGLIAEKMAEALKLNPSCNLLGIASKTPTKAKKFAHKNNIPRTYTYQELVTSQEIDVIYVATTHNFHFENTKLALEHGKPVLVEKPFTVNAEEARKLIALARTKNLFLMEAMWIRFLPSHILLKNIIQNQEIGTVKVCQLNFGKIVEKAYQNRLESPDLAGGATLDLGVYPISFLSYLLGELPCEIKSMANFSGGGVDEICQYLFRFPSGVLADVSVSYNLHMLNNAILFGSKGYLKYPNFQTGEKFTLGKHNGTNTILDTQEFEEKNHSNGFIYQVEEVVKCLKTNQSESKYISLDETLGIMKVMDRMRNEWGLVYPFE